jgi:fatty acid desaturase
MQGAKDVMRTTKVRHRWNLLNLLEFAPRVAVSIIKNDLRFVDQMKRRQSPWFRQYMMESWAVILATGVLLVLDWQKALIVWLIPHIYAAWGIITINYLQHDGCDPDHSTNHSRNFVGRTVNWWTFNNGLHGVHHNHPSLHWSRAREEHERLMVPNMDPRLNEPSLVLYWVRAFLWPGIRKRYDGTEAPLPERVADESWVVEASESRFVA